jgi:outer membrane protein assembly factor BamA
MLRGYTLADSLFGTRVGLATAELRFPFVDHFAMAFPLPLELRSVRGVAFIDIGTAWEEEREFLLWQDVDGEPELVDLKLGFGAGMRIRLPFLVVRYDVGWGSNLREVTKPRHYLTLGPEF